MRKHLDLYITDVRLHIESFFEFFGIDSMTKAHKYSTYYRINSFLSSASRKIILLFYLVEEYILKKQSFPRGEHVLMNLKSVTSENPLVIYLNGQTLGASSGSDWRSPCNQQTGTRPAFFLAAI